MTDIVLGMSFEVRAWVQLGYKVDFHGEVCLSLRVTSVLIPV